MLYWSGEGPQPFCGMKVETFNGVGDPHVYIGSYQKVTATFLWFVVCLEAGWVVLIPGEHIVSAGKADL